MREIIRLQHLFCRYISKILRIIQLGLHLANRALGNIQKLHKLLIAIPLKTLGDIGWHGNCRTLNLLPKPIVFCKRPLASKSIYSFDKLATQLPNYNIFKSLESCHTCIISNSVTS